MIDINVRDTSNWQLNVVCLHREPRRSMYMALLFKDGAETEYVGYGDTEQVAIDDLIATIRESRNEPLQR